MILITVNKLIVLHYSTGHFFIFLFRSPGFRTITFISQGGSSEIFAGHGTLSKEDASFFDPARAQCLKNVRPSKTFVYVFQDPMNISGKIIMFVVKQLSPPPPNLEHINPLLHVL